MWHLLPVKEANSQTFRVIHGYGYIPPAEGITENHFFSHNFWKAKIANCKDDRQETAVITGLFTMSLL
jgi:hypothetical protein